MKYTNMAQDTSASLTPDETIDVRGLQCPLPVLKARKKLKSLKLNQLLRVIATDPAAVIDFPHFCNEAGHDLVHTGESEGELTFIIRKTHG